MICSIVLPDKLVVDELTKKSRVFHVQVIYKDAPPIAM